MNDKEDSSNGIAVAAAAAKASGSKAVKKSGTITQTLFPVFAKRSSTGKENNDTSRIENGATKIAGSSSPDTAVEPPSYTPEASSSKQAFQEPSYSPPPSTAKAGASMTQHATQNDAIASTSCSGSTSKPPSTPPKIPGQEIIEISDSPLKDTPPVLNMKTFDDYRAERDAKRAVKRASGWDGNRLPLWPSRDNLHVLPTDTSSAAALATRRKRWKGKERAVELEDDSSARYCLSDCCTAVHSLLQGSKAKTEKSTQEEMEDFTSHPLLARMVGEAGPSSATPKDVNSLRTTMYAPTYAAEVLGTASNESALLLREWLQEHSLQDSLPSTPSLAASPAKRKIKREIGGKEKKRLKRDEKRRKRKHGRYHSDDEDDLADFVADDDEEAFEHYDYYDLPDEPFQSSPEKSASSVPPTSRFSALTNLILLTGPPASGKTSAVYAVAKELDWQVFEVYPGIGKRGAKDLDRYVGMVGQNHIIKGEGSGKPIADMFRQPKRNDDAEQPDGASVNAKFRQSLILVEEVDILYASDIGFWEGLVSLVAKSRRPVILTCNDTFAIPFHILPLQTTLHFAQPSDSVKEALLRCMPGFDNRQKKPCNNGHALTQSYVMLPSDLRQCLMASHLAIPEVASSSTEDLPFATVPRPDHRQSYAHAAETISYVDAELSNSERLEIADMEDVTLDEEDWLVGHPDRPFGRVVPLGFKCFDAPLTCYARNAEFARAILGCELLGLGNQERLEHLDRVATVTATEVDTFYVSLTASCLHVDYLPFLRTIVEAEDIHEKAYNEAMMLDQEDVVLDTRIRRSRRLAGSAKEKYRRYGDMPDEIAENIRSTSLLAV